jgi:DNA mismatch repair protein MutL
MKKPFLSDRGVIRPVKNLTPEVARKIAAGEVIDRPNAVVRELMDNAIDAGSYSITVEITGGGIDSICVSDDGIGLSKEDLEHCAKPHATSKIEHETDLLKLSTLGFRGEALASIAAVSRLDITSRRKEEKHGWHLHAEVAKDYDIEPAILERGTKVQSSGLFENFPARRLFLKRPASEGNLCRQTFIEKALPFPDIAFRFLFDNSTKLFFPSVQTKKERFTQAFFLENQNSLFSELTAADPSPEPQWNISVVIGDTEVTRTDRKLIHIYVNNRKINEYSLIQAVEYGCEGYFPNALHPVCCVFIEINPSLVDFNIHPAKKEARFKDIGPIHHALSSTLRSFFRSHSLSEHYATSTDQDFLQKENSFSPCAQAPLNNKSFSYSTVLPREYKQASESSAYSNNSSQPFHHFVNKPYEPAQTDHDKTSQKDDFTYFGSFESLFLLVEKDGLLYIIDQHAGHERVLFNRFMNSYGKKQELLIPYIITTDSDDDDMYLHSITSALDKAGFTISQREKGIWEVQSVNAHWQGTEKDLEKEILEKKYNPDDLVRSIAASAACRAAVKDNDYLDSSSAIQLIREIFNLEDPHCPHGRPVWTIITKEELFARVKRT